MTTVDPSRALPERGLLYLGRPLEPEILNLIGEGSIPCVREALKEVVGNLHASQSPRSIAGRITGLWGKWKETSSDPDSERVDGEQLEVFYRANIEKIARIKPGSENDPVSKQVARALAKKTLEQGSQIGTRPPTLLDKFQVDLDSANAQGLDDICNCFILHQVAQRVSHTLSREVSFLSRRESLSFEIPSLEEIPLPDESYTSDDRDMYLAQGLPTDPESLVRLLMVCDFLLDEEKMDCVIRRMGKSEYIDAMPEIMLKPVYRPICKEFVLVKLLKSASPLLVERFIHVALSDPSDAPEISGSVLRAVQKSVLLDAFVVAAEHGHIGVVAAIVRCFGSEGITSYHLGEAFVIAAKNGHIDIVAAILRLRGFAPIMKWNLKEALIGAAKHGHTDVVVAMMRDRTFVMIPKEALDEAFECACEKSHMVILTAMMGHRGPIEIKADDLGRVFKIATEYGHMDVVDTMMGHARFAEIQKDDLSKAFERSAGNGHIDVVTALLKHPAYTGMKADDLLPSLRIAISEGHMDVATALLKHPACTGMKVDDIFPTGSEATPSVRASVETLLRQLSDSATH